MQIAYSFLVTSLLLPAFWTVQEARSTEHPFFLNMAHYAVHTPLRSGKGSAYEGGYRVPMIVAWAGQKPSAKPLHASLPILPGSTCAEPVHMDDFFPTFLDMERDGQTLVPLLRGQAFERKKPLFWHYPRFSFRVLSCQEPR